MSSRPVPTVNEERALLVILVAFLVGGLALIYLVVSTWETPAERDTRHVDAGCVP